ncbi:MAG: phosphate/phosphite/phosphonate ABC transporter substrate-binding protein [Pyrobaculum sp.]
MASRKILYIIPAAVLVVVAAVLIALATTQPAPHSDHTVKTQDGRQLGAAEKLVFVVNPGVMDRVTVREAEELRKFLEERLGVPVEIYYPTAVPALVEALKFKHAHVALGVGTLVSAIAMKEAEVDMLLVEYRDVVVDDKRVVAPFYYSYFIVLKESPYQTLDELKGKRACFPSETSVSGFVMPMKFLYDNGYIDAAGIKRPRDLAEKLFGEVIFGGGYAQCWEALRTGRVDVTVMAGDVALSLYYEAMNNSRVLRTRDGKLAVAGPNPSHTVLVRKDLPPELKKKIRDVLLELNQMPELMKKYVSAIFVKFEERDPIEHLGPLIKALTQLGLIDFYLGRR